MHSSGIRELLDSVKGGTLSVEQAIQHLKNLPYEDIAFAKVDHHRQLRQGIPEVIYAKDKKMDEIKGIAESMYRRSKKFLITKASRDIYDFIGFKEATFYPASGTIALGGELKKKKKGVIVVSAGTSDIPVAEEAAVTASFLGSGDRKSVV
jgi:NCAIR mutase (PurE)-related protein